VAASFTSVLRRLFTTSYAPDAGLRTFLTRAQTQQCPLAEVTVAVLDAKESERFFGVNVARRGIQPVHLRIENRSKASIRLQLVSIDPNYYTPLEAAALNHYSITKRLSAFGLMGWLFLPLLALLVPLLVLVPLKLITAYRANRRMDEFFRSRAFHLHPIPAGGASEGFVFTPFDAGTKIVHVRLVGAEESLETIIRVVEAAAGDAGNPPQAAAASATMPVAEFTFSIPVPGIAVDYLRRDFETLVPPKSLVSCNVRTLVERLCAMPGATTNAKDFRMGDPVNLVVIGDFDRLLSGFAARWDESETISFTTCWKTMRAFLLGSDYRYSPVSALHLFGRSQDLALQRTRRSINERLHLRL